MAYGRKESAAVSQVLEVMFVEITSEGGMFATMETAARHAAGRRYGEARMGVLH